LTNGCLPCCCFAFFFAQAQVSAPERAALFDLFTSTNDSQWTSETDFNTNNDGFHNLWKRVDDGNVVLGRVYIFDRYGKLLKQIDANTGHWDGKYNGLEMPASDYWYHFVDTETGDVITGHFSLLR
jgi:gliding motility-associated-like protein